MRGHFQHRKILDALLRHLPGSAIDDYRERDWRSMTFDGRQIHFAINVGGGIAEDRTKQFVDGIVELELPAGKFFVADISATLAEANRIEIEMLLIKE